ncbi:MAG: YIP1 family protein [Gammaproteobacteria bacterium]|nr:YIP1 family protein [Gammaproteobacteria bacterium]MDE2346261.1 YIP1 family protein [Gammaproteobacteria bacterium]
MNNQALASLGNIFVEPKTALQDIRTHISWFLYPLIISTVLIIAFTVWYYATVDIGWLANQMTAALGDKYSSDQLEQIRQNFTRTRFIVGSAVFIPISIIALSLLQALYLFLVSKIGGYEEQSYGRWFNFSVWTGFPMILSTIASGITYLFSSHQVTYYTLDITSLNTLLFHLPLNNHMMGVAASLHLTTFWILALMIFGFAQWNKLRLGKSTIIVLAPWVIIYALIIIIKLA